MMSEKRGNRTRTAAEMIAWLGRLFYTNRVDGGLVPSQYMALRYFSRANRFSQTVSALADYHGITRGTASKIVKGLVQQRYLRQTRSLVDGRSAEVNVTAKGRIAIKKDPFWRLVRAIDRWNNTAQGRFAGDLGRLSLAMAEDLERPSFGRCADCKYKIGDGSPVKGKSLYRCGLIDIPLKEKELEQICVNYIPD